MRTAIFTGLIAIADAINKNWHKNNQGVMKLYAFVLGAVIIFDILEFLIRMTIKRIKK